MRVVSAPALLALALGCGPEGPPSLEGFGETAGDGDGDGDGPEPPNPGDGDGDEPEPPSGDCIDADLGSQPEAFWSADLDPDAPRDHAIVCGDPTPGPDYSMQWRAPFSGTFRAELGGASPLALAILEGGCDGSTVACEPFSGFSVLEFEAVVGQSFVFVVDQPFEDFSSFEFFVYPLGGPPPPPPPPGSCPDGVLPDDTNFSISGSTNGAGNTFGSGCGGEAASDRSFLFVPPVSGLYSFDTLGSNYDTMLYVLDGECGGPELACNDDTFELLSRVEVQLSAGQVYTVVVDGYDVNAGAFDLNVALLDGEQSLCADITDLGSEAPVQSNWSTQFFDSHVFAACTDLPLERRFRWQAPQTGMYRASFDTIAAGALAVVLDGCSGGGALCNEGFDLMSTEFEAVEGQELVFVAEWEFADPGPASLFVEPLFDPIEGCGESLGVGGLPVITSGSTSGSGDQHNGSCSVNGAPEVELHWTPAAAGTYFISLEGSNYDTMLYVRRGGCDGDELVCNDDSFIEDTWFLWSSATVELESGETISIFVDGYNGSGDYDLSITEI